MSFKKYDGGTWQPITPKKLKGISYTGTLPATLSDTKVGHLYRYKIYGNLEQTGTPTPENPIVPQECGERTENLFDEEYPGYAAGSILKYRPIYVGQGTFTLSTTFPQMTDYADLLFLAGNVSTGGSTGNDGVWSERPITVESIDGYVTIAYRRFSASHPDLRDYNTMLNSGSTALPYEPYGYKLPLTSAGQNVDIYLGDDTLSTEEYIDSGTGKIYRMVDGVLTPIDPPMSFPQIPTSANSTTISWAGSGLAPSQFDSIQEWVNIPTYTRVNGEWVAE